MKQTTEFGKAVKKKLVDLDQTQRWLIDEVKSDTGLYFDSGYLHRILVGEEKTPSIITSITKILDIEGWRN